MNWLKTLKLSKDHTNKTKTPLSHKSQHQVNQRKRLQSRNRLKQKIHPTKSAKMLLQQLKKRLKLKKARITNRMDFSIQLAIQHSNKKIDLVSTVITEEVDWDTEETTGVIVEGVEADRTLTTPEIPTTIIIGEGTKKLLEKSLEKMILRRDLAIRNLR